MDERIVSGKVLPEELIKKLDAVSKTARVTLTYTWEFTWPLSEFIGNHPTPKALREDIANTARGVVYNKFLTPEGRKAMQEKWCVVDIRKNDVNT